MNNFNNRILALTLSPAALTAVYGLVNILRDPGAITLATALIFVILSVVAGGALLVIANREFITPLVRLGDKLKLRVSTSSLTTPDTSHSNPIQTVDALIEELRRRCEAELEAARTQHHRLRETISRLESANRQERETLDRFRQDVAVEGRYRQHLTNIARYPLRSFIGFTNLIINMDRETVSRSTYEVERSARHLLFLMDELTADTFEQVPDTRFSLIQVLDEALAFFHPLAMESHHAIYPLIAEGCPDHIVGNDARLKSTVFNYLLYQFTEGRIPPGDLLLDVSYGADEAVVFALTSVEGPESMPNERLGVLIDSSGATLKDGVLTIPVAKAEPIAPPPSFEDVTAVVLDENVAQRRSLVARLSRLGIDVRDATSMKDVDLLFIGDLTEPVSAPGHETVFLLGNPTSYRGRNFNTLRRPVDQDELIRSLQSVLSAHRPTDTYRVLAVDDNEPNLRLAVLMLEELGLEVTSARNGKEALEVAAHEPVDLVIMDVQMPVLDGVNATRQIRQRRGRSLPVIGLTANPTPAEVGRLRSAGMDDVLEKPVTRDQLGGAIERWLPLAPKPPRAAGRRTSARALFDRGLAIELANGKADLADELFELLIASLPEARDTMNKAWQQGEAAVFKEALHKLSGSIRYCGVPRLTTAIDLLDKQQRAGVPDDRALDTVNREIEALLAWHRTGLNLDQDAS